MRRTGAALAAVLGAAALSCAPSRDVAEPRTTTTQAGPGPSTGAGYTHVARRPLVTVAIGEVVGIPEEPGRAALEALADAFEGCAEDLARQQKLVSGAARIVAKVSREGAVETVALTVSPGDAVKANALLCFVAPAKLLVFPASAQREVDRVLLVEAVWAPEARPRGGVDDKR